MAAVVDVVLDVLLEDELEEAAADLELESDPPLNANAIPTPAARTTTSTADTIIAVER